MTERNNSKFSVGVLYLVCNLSERRHVNCFSLWDFHIMRAKDYCFCWAENSMATLLMWKVLPLSMNFDICYRLLRLCLEDDDGLVVSLWMFLLMCQKPVVLFPILHLDCHYLKFKHLLLFSLCTPS